MFPPPNWIVGGAKAFFRHFVDNSYTVTEVTKAFPHFPAVTKQQRKDRPGGNLSHGKQEG
jgi:hypothetical protein